MEFDTTKSPPLNYGFFLNEGIQVWRPNIPDPESVMKWKTNLFFSNTRPVLALLGKMILIPHECKKCFSVFLVID